MILITGHRGFIGQNMMAAFPGSRGYEWGDGEVDLDGISRVIHLGAITDTQCGSWPALMAQNVAFTRDLLHACADRRIPIQIASSASVYGDGPVFREDAPVAPQTRYAQSKRMIELYTLDRDWPMPVQLFRYFNVYGPHEEHKSQPSPHTRFRRQAAETGRIEVFEGSKGIARDFVPVERVIEIHRAFFDLDASGVYNVGTGTAKSFWDVALDVASETKAEIVEVPMPSLSGYQWHTCADMTKTLGAMRDD
jgi:ADP-L-glycero-D-manno-heptose 6-epimerase